MIRRIPPVPRHRGPRDADRPVIEHLARALAAADGDGIRSVLARGVVLVIDSGGAVATAATPLIGSGPVSTALAALAAPGTAVAPAAINGRPGLVLVREGVVVAAITAEVAAGSLSRVWVVCNPEKLRHWNV